MCLHILRTDIVDRKLFSRCWYVIVISLLCSRNMNEQLSYRTANAMSLLRRPLRLTGQPIIPNPSRASFESGVDYHPITFPSSNSLTCLQEERLHERHYNTLSSAVPHQYEEERENTNLSHIFPSMPLEAVCSSMLWRRAEYASVVRF